MRGFAVLASVQVLIPVVILTFVWIILNGKDRKLESLFLLIIVIGGEIWDEGLRRLFHRVGPGNIPYTFPSEQSFTSLIVLGFTVFLWVRHIKKVWIQYLAPLTVVVDCILVGLSRIFFEVQYPSDVVAGYVFGGVWLSLNVLLVEIFRFIRHPFSPPPASGSTSD